MSFDKDKTDILTIGTLPAQSTLPATPGTWCEDIDMTVSSSLAITMEGSFTTGGTLTAHIRTSPTGGTVESVWDTQDYASFDLVATAGSREQITKGVWCDPLYACVMVVNDGTEAVTNVVVTSTVQDMEAV